MSNNSETVWDTRNVSLNYDYETGVGLSDSVNKTCVKRPLAEKSRWRHIRLAIKPCYLWNYASQMKSYYRTLSGSHDRSFRIRHKKSPGAPHSGEITMTSYPVVNDPNNIALKPHLGAIWRNAVGVLTWQLVGRLTQVQLVEITTLYCTSLRQAGTLAKCHDTLHDLVRPSVQIYIVNSTRFSPGKPNV